MEAIQKFLDAFYVNFFCNEYATTQLHPCAKEVSKISASNFSHVDDRNLYHVIYHFKANFIGFSKIPKSLSCDCWLLRSIKLKELWWEIKSHKMQKIEQILSTLSFAPRISLRYFTM